MLYRVHAAQTLFCNQITTVPVILSSICKFVNSQILNIVDSKWSQGRQDCVVEKGEAGGTACSNRSWAWFCSVAAKDKMILNLYKSSVTGQCCLRL